MKALITILLCLISTGLFAAGKEASTVRETDSGTYVFCYPSPGYGTCVTAGSLAGASGIGNYVASASTNSPLTGSCASSACALTIGLGTVGISNGGTNITTYAAGDFLYASAVNTLAKLAGNNTATEKVMAMTNNVPKWTDNPTLTSTLITYIQLVPQGANPQPCNAGTKGLVYSSATALCWCDGTNYIATPNTGTCP